MYYGAYNSRAELDRGNHGFSNTWTVVRFKTKADRSAFLEAFENKKAKACTRKQAGWVWEDNYLTAGDKAPRGGLFNGADGFDGVDWKDIDPVERQQDTVAWALYAAECDRLEDAAEMAAFEKIIAKVAEAA